MENENLTYEQALEQLKKIVYDIEQGNITVDQLNKKVTEARRLFEFCLKKLTKIEDEVTEILKSFPESIAQTTENL